jgi:hypothetical protein
MATLQFTVWEYASDVANGDPIQEDVVAIGGGSLQSDPIVGSNRKRQRVRVVCDTNAWVTWGANPTALDDGTAGRMMGQENPEYFEIEAGHRLAVIERV